VTEKPRLLYLSLETPREGQATFTHVHEIINGLRGLGWQVELIATKAGGASSGSSYLARLLDYVRAQRELISRLHEADAVFMRSHFAALPASFVANRRGVPVFQEINGRPDDIFVTYRWLGWIGPLIRNLYASQMGMAAHVLVVTEGLKAWALVNAGHDRVSVVSNGANTQLFSPEGPPSPTPGTYIAFVGGLTNWHGIGTMIAATRDPAWPSGVKLVIVGDGVERAQLAGLENDPRILWLGKRPQAEVAAVLRGALAALAITEDTAGHLDTGAAPLKLFEAMASGAPMIVTDLPFQADLIRQEDAGLVIPMADPASLAQAAAALADNPQGARAMGLRGAAYIKAYASWQKRAEEIAAVIEPIIAARQRETNG
jgi:glycosyltransferase involved in cell wall biosynthesis